VSGIISIPGRKPFFNPLMRKSTNSLSGWSSKAVVLRYFKSQSGRAVGLWGPEALE